MQKGIVPGPDVWRFLGAVQPAIGYDMTRARGSRLSDQGFNAGERRQQQHPLIRLRSRARVVSAAPVAEHDIVLAIRVRGNEQCQAGASPLACAQRSSAHAIRRAGALPLDGLPKRAISALFAAALPALKWRASGGRAPWRPTAEPQHCNRADVRPCFAVGRPSRNRREKRPGARHPQRNGWPMPTKGRVPCMALSKAPVRRRLLWRARHDRFGSVHNRFESARRLAQGRASCSRCTRCMALHRRQ